MVPPDVSIVIPTRNRCRMLLQAVRSALRQQGPGVEVLVVDEASEDATSAALAALRDRRVRVIRHDRPWGVSRARNHGVEEARGRWVAFVDDDDFLGPGKLASQVRAAVDAGASWSFTGSAWVDDAWRVLNVARPHEPSVVADQLLTRNVVPAGASNVMASRAALVELRGFDTGLRHASDWDLWIRLALKGPPATVDEPLVAYRLHGSSASFDETGMVEELDVIAGRYEAARAARGVRLDRAAYHRWIAWSHLRAGRRRQAIVQYGHAVRGGDWRSLLRAGVVAGHPGIGRGEVLFRRRPDAGACAAAQVWIDDFAAELGAHAPRHAGDRRR